MKLVACKAGKVKKNHRTRTENQEVSLSYLLYFSELHTFIRN
jgi:hypothetical protein